MDQSDLLGQAPRRGLTDGRICSCERRAHVAHSKNERFPVKIPICTAVSRGLALPLPRGVGELKDQLEVARCMKARPIGSSRRALV